MKRSLFPCIGVILLISVFSVAGESKKPETSRSTAQFRDLFLSVSLMSRVPVKGKTIAHIQLRNEGKEDIWSSVGPGFCFRVLTPQGKQVLLTPRGYARDENSKPLGVPAGKAVEFDFDISGAFRINAPNLYKFVVDVPFNDQDNQSWGEIEAVVPFYVGNPPTPWLQPKGGV